MKFLASICTVLLIGCAAPGFQVAGELSVVTAPEPNQARSVYHLIAEHGPTVARMLGVEPVPLQLEVVREEYIERPQGKLHGYSRPGGHIVLTQSALREGGHRILHEACHAYGEQAPWVALLPPFLLEGLCTFVALEAVDETDWWRRNVDCRVSVPVETAAELWSHETIYDAEGSITEAYVYGFRVFDRAGVPLIRSWTESGELTEDRVRTLFARGAYPDSRLPRSASGRSSSPLPIPITVRRRLSETPDGGRDEAVEHDANVGVELHGPGEDRVGEGQLEVLDAGPR